MTDKRDTLKYFKDGMVRTINPLHWIILKPLVDDGLLQTVILGKYLITPKGKAWLEEQEK